MAEDHDHQRQRAQGIGIEIALVVLRMAQSVLRVNLSTSIRAGLRYRKRLPSWREVARNEPETVDGSQVGKRVVDDVSSLAGREHPLLGRLELAFDPQSRTLARGGRRRHLAPRESEVLAALLRAEAGRVIARNELLDAVWGPGDVCEDALTVIISRLRRHFQRLGIDEPVIETVPRRGYRMGECENAAGGWREARRDGRLGRTLGLASLVLSALAVSVSCLALLVAMG
jgi:hypothetical protein